MRAGSIMWGALIVCFGVSLFLVKYKVQGLEDELTAKREMIVRDHGAIRVLEAEWTYLNDPERLRRLSAQYLGFGPAVPKNVIEIAALPMRPATPAGATHEIPSTEAAPTNEAPVSDSPTPAAHAALHAAASPPVTTRAAFQRPAGLPVILARLQRLLFPDAVGATTFEENAR